MRDNVRMQAHELVAAISRRVAPVAARNSRVSFIYVFGSAARGKQRPDSDVDLAVSSGSRGMLIDDARLHDELAAALDRDVDLVMLNEAPLWLQYRVVGGQVVFSRDERARIAFRERVEKEFLDFRYYHDSYLEAVRERSRRGALTGG